jgi:hypothetical protein
MSTQGTLAPFLKPIDSLPSDRQEGDLGFDEEYRRFSFDGFNERVSQTNKDEDVSIIALNNLTFQGFLDKFLAATVIPSEKINIVDYSKDTARIEEGRAYFSLGHTSLLGPSKGWDGRLETLNLEQNFHFYIGSIDLRTKGFQEVEVYDHGWWAAAVMTGDKYGANKVFRQSTLVQREFVYFPGTNFSSYDNLNYDSYARVTLPLTRQNLLRAMQHFKGFFEKLLGGEGVIKRHLGAKMSLGRSSKKAELKIYYPKVDDAVLPPLEGYTRRQQDFQEDLEDLLDDPALGVDRKRRRKAIDDFMEETGIAFPLESIEPFLKRQRSDETAALLLRRNGGDVEAAAQMLAKLRFY